MVQIDDGIYDIVECSVRGHASLVEEVNRLKLLLACRDEYIKELEHELRAISDEW